MWFLCGLGNPDKKYKFTRHNLGFNILDSIIEKNNCILIKKDKYKELYKGKIGIHDCMFCKPLNYMNLSGPIIGELSNFYKIPESKIIVIHDDLDLALGKIKIKTGGGSGGHNGLRSIDQTIGKNYKRLRVGIDHPGSKELVSTYVLEKFTKEERKVIDNKISILKKYFSLIFEDDALLLTKIAS